jgi:hypothetical protein
MAGLFRGIKTFCTDALGVENIPECHLQVVRFALFQKQAPEIHPRAAEVVPVYNAQISKYRTHEDISCRTHGEDAVLKAFPNGAQ